MTFKLLIDECLSPTLVAQARAAGHSQSTCVRDRGWSGAKDWQLVERAIRDDLTLVTHNARDFRGPAPGQSAGLYARQPLHAGLICLASAQPMGLERQRDLFGYVLAELDTLPDLVNQCLEVFEDDDGMVTIALYEIPEAWPVQGS